MILHISEATYAAIIVALEHVAERVEGTNVAARMQEARRDIKGAFDAYCNFTSGDEVPALLKRQA